MIAPSQIVPSQYQQDFYSEVQYGSGHIIVEAVAGAGKTTTLVEAIHRVPANRRVLMCAFNSEIQKELARRIPYGAEIRTLHSLGFAALRRQWGSKLFVDKTSKKDFDTLRIAMRSIGITPSKDITSALKHIVSRAKDYLAWTDEQIRQLCCDQEFDFEPWVGNVVRQAMYLSTNPTGSVSYDDMIYVPLYLGLMRPAYDVIFVDETQDLNLAQWTLIRQSVAPHGRIIAVGDRHQTIYGFRGARTNGMVEAARDLNAKVMPLSVTYRCPRSVVQLAKQYVPHIEAAPTAEDGTVRHATIDQFWRDVHLTDLVLSRTNRVVVSLCLKAFQRGLRARAIGRDLGKGLLEIIDEADTHSVPTLMQWLSLYEASERERLIAADREEFIDNLYDRIESIRCLSEGLSSVQHLRERVIALCVDDDRSDALRFSNVHRAKGLEEWRVWVVTNTFQLENTNPVKRQEEENLYYVAITRAKNALQLITLPQGS